MTSEDFKEEIVTLSDAERLCELYGWKHIWDDLGLKPVFDLEGFPLGIYINPRTNLLIQIGTASEKLCLMKLCGMLIKAGVFEIQSDEESETEVEIEEEILSDFFKFLEE